MKLIHLSDLHLGKRVNEFSMLEDQEYILQQIFELLFIHNSLSYGYNSVDALYCNFRFGS